MIKHRKMLCQYCKKDHLGVSPYCEKYPLSEEGKWNQFRRWWKQLDDTDYSDQYALMKAISEKIKELK